MISMALIATALSIWLLERAGLFKEMRARDATRSWFRGGSSFCTCSSGRFLDLPMVGSWVVHAGASNLTKTYQNHLKP